MPFTPDSLRIAMVTRWSEPEPEPKLTHKIRQSSRPVEMAHRIGTIYLVNRSDTAVTVELNTGGYYSNDDALQILSGRTRTVSMEARSALLLETADEKSGDFECHIWYTVTVPLAAGTRVCGTFGISLYPDRELDSDEDDPVLGVKARIIRPKAWELVTR